MIRVILADDHAVMRDGLRYILETAGGFEIVGEASDGSATLALVERGAADVLLLDLSMPAPTGIELIRLVKRHAPSLRTLVLTMHAEAQYAARAFKAGATGYLTKDSATAETVEAVGKVAAGGVYVAVGGREPRAHAAHAGRRAAARTAVRARVRRDAPHRRRPDRHADRDRTRAQRKDVSTYKTRILEKMELPHEAALVRYAVRHELDPGGDA